MYRVKKVLNHNAVIVIRAEEAREYLMMGKGIGFGKKISEEIEPGKSDKVYSLQDTTERGDSRKLAASVAPVCLEIADEVLDEAEKIFGKIDRSILFPMADHIEYAVKRIQNNEEIRNPLTEDIRVLFHMEFKAAQCIERILQERLNISIGEDETGYIALHIHSAIEDENVAQSMQIAQNIRQCVSLVEKESGRQIDILSLSYNRLMNHIRYMAARAARGEQLKLNMNDYMEVKFPKSFQIAKLVYEQFCRSLKCTLSEAEIGYLAMHIERVTSGELDS